MTKILILRFSAMGDVVLLVPVLRSLMAAHSNVEVTVVTRPRFAPFFSGIDRIKVFEADIDAYFIGFFGLRKLFMALIARADFDMVIDMHDHLRTVVLRGLFTLFGLKVFKFNKGRTEKKAFTRKANKVTTPLMHTIERYRAAFEIAGFPFEMLPGPYLLPRDVSKHNMEKWLNRSNLTKKEKWIGIAPFAVHKTKIWPLANYATLIDQLTKRIPARIFFFGGGAAEIKFFEDLHQLFPNHCTLVAGQLKMQQEFALMQQLDLMLCVDSANMHFASLTGTPVLTIWGGTHPDVGFGPYGNASANIIQIDTKELPCRPCSVYGKEKCHRGDFACLTRITPDMVAERVVKQLS
jgi:ADP-heptose:LPS heptosyltransferase